MTRATQDRVEDVLECIIAMSITAVALHVLGVDEAIRLVSVAIVTYWVRRRQCTLKR